MTDTLTFATSHSTATGAALGGVSLVLIVLGLTLLVLTITLPIAVARIWTHTHATQRAITHQTGWLGEVAKTEHKARAAQLAQMQETQKVIAAMAAEIRSLHNDFKTQMSWSDPDH